MPRPTPRGASSAGAPRRRAGRSSRTSRSRPGAAALGIAASGVAGTVASIPVAQALGYTKTLSWVSLDPPLTETFAVVTREPASLSPGTRAMIELVEQHMRMLHRELQSA